MFQSTKVIELGSCAFRQPSATSHCKWLHGYFLTVKFWFAAETLDEKNWVFDFGGLKTLKETLEKQFDHTTVISKHDPFLPKFEELHQLGVIDLRVMDGVGVEKFAEYCLNAANNFVNAASNGRVRCVKAEVFEHPKNSAIFKNE
jgi:6-pyruvoyltetrahydropterin/6-carboxytetrahydropterin synthase